MKQVSEQDNATQENSKVEALESKLANVRVHMARLDSALLELPPAFNTADDGEFFDVMTRLFSAAHGIRLELEKGGEE